MGDQVKVHIGKDYIPTPSRRERRDSVGYQHFKPAPTVDMERLQSALLGPYHARHLGDYAVGIACAVGFGVVVVLGLMGWLR